MADKVHFSSSKSREVQADFSGGDTTSYTGVLLLRQIDRELQLSKAISRIVNDPRDTSIRPKPLSVSVFSDSPWAMKT